MNSVPVICLNLKLNHSLKPDPGGEALASHRFPYTSPHMRLLLSVKLQITQEEWPHSQATMLLNDVVSEVKYFFIFSVPSWNTLSLKCFTTHMLMGPQKQNQHVVVTWQDHRVHVAVLNWCHFSERVKRKIKLKKKCSAVVWLLPVEHTFMNMNIPAQYMPQWEM